MPSCFIYHCAITGQDRSGGLMTVMQSNGSGRTHRRRFSVGPCSELYTAVSVVLAKTVRLQMGKPNSPQKKKLGRPAVCDILQRLIRQCDDRKRPAKSGVGGLSSSHTGVSSEPKTSEKPKTSRPCHAEQHSIESQICRDRRSSDVQPTSNFGSVYFQKRQAVQIGRGYPRKHDCF
jgi:hypothetical protein